MRQVWLGLAALSLASVTACSGGPRGDFGYLPQLSGLTCDPASLAVGTESTVTGRVSFWAPDTSLVYLFVRVVDPSGQEGPLQRFGVGYAYGYSTGVLEFQVKLNPPVPGTYQLKVFVKDINGQNSDPIAVALPAT